MNYLKIFSFLLLFSCGGKSLPTEFLKPVTKDNKLAFTLYNYNQIVCKTKCLIDEAHETKEYQHALTQEVEDFTECPLYLRVFACKDIHTEKEYLFTPAQWQADAQFLFNYFYTPHIKKTLSQNEFMCEQDFVLCENQFSVIKTLEEFLWERDK